MMDAPPLYPNSYVKRVKRNDRIGELIFVALLGIAAMTINLAYVALFASPVAICLVVAIVTRLLEGPTR